MMYHVYNAKITNGILQRTKQLLHNVAGNLRPGEMTAIIGPSGAGKTTLLNVLSGFQSRSFQGDLFVNGQPLKDRSFRKLSSYVVNGEELLLHLTVRETVDAAAKLKLPADFTYKQRSAMLVFHLRLATHILVAVCMGLLYYDIGDKAENMFNNATLVFFSTIFLTFTA
ncbi:hypothetical protein HPB48_019058 [Haemaphysalis longicornis]|uniref:ABC transporter domain-containing protein n=1 Tax=Haemaphysalis longicornis TaxID=44386 RepID=A0A9J6GJA5_HAELO|nr:hypothetical protein HPB48_019058 [Haemaphysalis longicornis]